MKKLVLVKTCLSALFISALASAQQARGALITYDGFNYSPGSLAGQDGGTGWASESAWTGFGSPVDTVTAGSLTYLDLSTSGNKAYVTTSSGTSGVSRQLSTTYSEANTSTLYLSFEFNWDAGMRFFGLQLFNGSSSAVEFNKFGGQSNFGIQGGSGAAAISTGTTYFAVVEVLFNSSGNDIVNLYLSPSDLGTQPAVVTSTRSFATLQFDTVRLSTGYESVSQGATAAASFDEVRIGTSWADVAPQIPEPSTIGYLALGAACMVALLVRKRKQD